MQDCPKGSTNSELKSTTEMASWLVLLLNKHYLARESIRIQIPIPLTQTLKQYWCFSTSALNSKEAGLLIPFRRTLLGLQHTHRTETSFLEIPIYLPLQPGLPHFPLQDPQSTWPPQAWAPPPMTAARNVLYLHLHPIWRFLYSLVQTLSPRGSLPDPSLIHSPSLESLLRTNVLGTGDVRWGPQNWYSCR